jgi:orotidine-5'-phosphate decarboxylase
VRNAHNKDLGAIVLTLMSNQEAEEVMVKTIVNGQPYYLHIAKMVKNSKADGCVIGLTGFVKGEYIKKVQKITGDKIIFLMQGIGPQGGEITNIKYARNPLISLGRSVIYSDNPKEEIKKYYDMFKSIKKEKINF